MIRGGCVKISEIFVNDVNRHIDPVIKVEDDKNIIQELEEYVVTDRIAENLIDFFESYNESAQNERKDIGVWISGFFGSGKSHFAKIMGYLLENRRLEDGRYAIDIFSNRIKGLDQETEIKGLLHQASLNLTSHSIMYQIESEHDQLDEKKSISKTIYKQFLKHQGLSDNLHIAELEQDLISQEKYDDFKDEIRKITGKDWKEVRKSPLFSKKPIGQALYNLFPSNFNSADEAKEEFENKYQVKLDISTLANKINNYVKHLEKAREKSPHMVFIIDEIGQFIGDSDDLLLELQTLSEDFGKIGLGRIWLIVTSQEKLDQVIEGVKKKEEGYKKIMDRFETKLHLTSENIVKVLEERILKKKEVVLPDLNKVYDYYQGVIAYASKMEGANRPTEICDMNNFVLKYPFMPYQLETTQQIFSNIRTQAGHGIRLTGAERSMLGVTQGILKSPETHFKNSDVGRIVAFDEIFDQIRTEISANIWSDINNVKVNGKADVNLAKRALKTLFLLQQIRWIPKTVSNISRGMINDLRVDTASFETQVKNALDALVEAKYVIVESGHYEYISGSKKLIEEEIFKETVKAHQKKRFAVEQLQDVMSINRLDYEGIKFFDVKVFGDDNEFSGKGDIVLKVYSPIFLEYQNTDLATVIDESHRSPNTVYWLSNPDIKIDQDIEKYLKTKSVIERKEKANNLSPEEIAIIRDKKQSMENLKNGIQTSIRRALLSGNIVYSGSNEELSGSSEKIETIFKRELSKAVPYIYTKFELAKYKVNENSIKSIITSKGDLDQIEKDLTLFDAAGNLNLHNPIVSEINAKIKQANDRGDLLTGGDLLDHFSNVPYGWDPILVRIAITALYRSGVIYLNSNGKDYFDYKKQDAQDLLINSRKFRASRLMIDPDVRIDKEEREQVQQKLNIIFSVKADDTINSLSKQVDEHLSDMVAEYDKRCLFWNQTGYNVKPEFYVIKETCDQVLNERNQAKKLKKFLEVSDDIQKECSYLEKMKGLFDREDVKLLSYVKRLPETINVNSDGVDKTLLDEYKANYAEIKAVIDSTEVVEKWNVILANYEKALGTYEKIYDLLHSQRCLQYEKMKKDIMGDSSLAGNIKPVTFDNIALYICPSNEWMKSEFRCDRCKTSLLELDGQILALDKNRDKIVSSLLPKKPATTTTGGGHAKPVPKEVKVSLRSVSKKAIIEKEEDLKEVIANIEKEIKDHLAKGETVILQ